MGPHLMAITSRRGGGTGRAGHGSDPRDGRTCQQSRGAVVAVISHERRAEPLSVVTSALGWGHVFRALRAEGESVQVCTINGSTTDGTIDVIGADFVRVRDEAGRELVIPFGLIAVVSGRR